MAGGERGLRGDAVRVVVTPPPGYPLAGYVDRRSRATGTLDELEAHVGRLSDADGATVVWVVLDVLAIDEAVRGRLARAVGAALDVDPADVVVVATHTHSAPSGWVGTIHPVLPAELDESLIDALVDAAAQACRRLAHRPLTLRWSVVDIAGGGANRHRPDGPHDRTAGVLSWYDPAGRPVAVLFDYACHPTVLGPDNGRYSADWVGVARQTIRDAVGDADLPVMFLQGAAGDVSPRFVRRGRDAAEVERLGSLIGRAVVDGVGDSRLLEPETTVRVRRATEVLPARDLATPPPAASAAPSPDGVDRVAGARVEGARAWQAMLAAGIPSRLRVPLTLVSVGGLRWLHLPAELFASYGIDLRAGDPATRVVGYTDGYIGYVADATAHAGGQYEALSSLLDPAGSAALVAAAARLLESGYSP